MKDLIKKILKERSGVSELTTSTPKTYSNKAGDTINDIKANGCKKTSVKDAVPRLDELSKETLGSYISKADKEVHDLNKKSARSKNLQRTYDLLVKVQKRRKGYSTATTKLSRKLAGERWGIKESIDLEEVQITVPALIRLCEIAREDIDGDTDLHKFIEALIENSNGTIDSQSIEDIESSDDDSDEDDIEEGEIVSADKKIGADGRLYPRFKKTIGKQTGSLTGAKL